MLFPGAVQLRSVDLPILNLSVPGILINVIDNRLSLNSLLKNMNTIGLMVISLLYIVQIDHEYH